MSKAQKITNILTGILMIVLSIIMLIIPDAGYVIVVFLLSISLIIYGIRKIVYYFAMARHMVGGRAILYMGIFVLDLGIFTITLYDIPQIFVMLYLIGMHAFYGVIDVLQAFEAKKYHAAWKRRLAFGIVNILIAVCCGIFIRRTEIAVYIYCAGLIYSGVVRITSALRRTAIVYIQ